MKHILQTLVIVLSINTGSFAQLADGSIAPDFTATDINGQSHSLFSDYLDNGKPVLIDISATWCGPCWIFHEGHALKDLYMVYGSGGSNEMGVLFIEGDTATGQSELEGNGNTQGNWIEGTPYPIIDNATISSLLEAPYYPTVYGICPDGKIYEFGQGTANTIKNQFESTCGISLNGAQDNVSLENSETTVCLTGSEATPSVNVVSHSSNTITSMNIDLFESGNPVAIESVEWEGNLTSLNSTIVEFTPIANFTSSQEYTAIASFPNGNIDNFSEYNEANVSVKMASFTEENVVTITIATDNYPGETSWKLKTGNGTVIESFGPYTEGDGAQGAGGPDANTSFTYDVALPEGLDCYELEISDTYGDGLSLANAAGYGITANGVDLINNFTNPNFGALVSDFFSADSDGNGTVAAINELKNVSVSVYPNPVSSNATVEISTVENSDVTLSLINILGELISSNIYNLNAGNNKVNLNVNNLESGIYFVQLNINGLTTTKKITVSK